MSNIKVYEEEENKLPLKQALTFEPEKNEVHKHPFIKAKKNGRTVEADYIPIDIIENKLDLLFGSWSIENMRYELILNSITVTLELIVYNKEGKFFAKRVGTSAQNLQTNAWDKQSGNKPIGYDFQIENFKPNAVAQALVVAKASAFKNAAQTLGNTLGRNLNREKIDDVWTTIANLENDLKQASSISALNAIFNKIPQRYRESLKPLFSDRKAELETK